MPFKRSSQLSYTPDTTGRYYRKIQNHVKNCQLEYLAYSVRFHHTVGMKQTLRGIALCAVGLEKITSKELERLGLRESERKPGRVYFDIEEKNLTQALSMTNIGLRTAERVLIEPGRFKAVDFDAFFDGIFEMPWEIFCYKDTKIHIERVRSHESKLFAQTSLQAMAQKAIYEKLMQTYRMRTMPETGNELAVRVYLDNDECSVGIDTSGDALHKRGYRAMAGQAPLKETIAASLLFLSGWNRKFALLDPLCGSGTIAIEAALYALNFAPGLNRRFAFESMPAVTPRGVSETRSMLESQIKADAEFSILASDIDPSVLNIARRNAEEAGVADWIRFEQKKAESAEPFSAIGHLITNPPYGNRLGTEEQAKALYTSLAPLGERFSEAGWGMGFITNIENFGEYFGRAPESIKHIKNGAEEQWYHWYPAIKR